MTFYVFNTGICTRVKLYGEDVRKLLILNEWHETNINDAQNIFINTCSFLQSKEKYFLSFISKINNTLQPFQKIYIIGCLPSTNKEAILAINKNIILFGRKIDDIANYFKFPLTLKYLSTSLDEPLNWKQKIIYYLNKFIFKNKHIDFRLKKNKVCHIQISYGCLGKCTYCSERFTTTLKSRKIDDILFAINDGLERNYQLFSLNSDDASAYGKDNNESLEQLLENILVIPKHFYLCIPEFNPNGLTPKIINLLKDRRILYITIPIQSGSNKILNKMKRPYLIEDVIKKISIIKKYNKIMKINTHIIVGFPGETKKDFEKTLNVIKQGYFDRIKIFKYSERPNTEASKMENKVSEEEKERRYRILKKQIIINAIKKLSIIDLILNGGII